MVLKRSNSPFNSGATQRCFNISRGMYRGINELSGLFLSITLKRLPYLYDQNDPSLEHVKALTKIYDYLGYWGPSLKAFYHSDSIDWDMAKTSLSIPLDNKELWYIPERFHKLMKERNFLNGEEGFAEIRVRKVKRIADRDTIHDKEMHVLNPKPKKLLKTSSKINVERPKGKHRGMQRSNMLSLWRERNKKNNDWQGDDFKTVVEIELQEQDQVDARVLGCRFDGHSDWKRIKSKLRSDVRLSGKKSYLYKMYSPLHRRKQTDTVLNSANVWEEDDYIFDDDDDEDDVDKVVENGEDSYDYHSRVQLSDYVIASNDRHRVEKKHKRGKHQENKHAIEEQFVNVNTASSQVTTRHVKGSFQFIARPRDIFENGERKVSIVDDFVHVRKDEIEELDNDDSEKQSINSEKPDIPIMFNTFDTNDKFIALNLHLPKNIQESAMFSSNNCPVMLGNCFPPVFCVNLLQSDSSLESGWSLVGSSCSEIFSDQELKWEVTLKNTKSCSEHGNDKVKDNFLCNLDLMNNRVLRLNDLIQMALVLVQNASSDHVENKEVVSTSKFVTKDFKSNLSVLTYNDSPRPKVCSMEVALNILQTEQIHNSQHLAPPSATKTNNIYIPSESIECDICFNACTKHGLTDSGLITLLPCNHSFCFECWQSHIFYHTKTVSSEIRCMATDCKEVLNDTMMKALIPEKHLAKLYSQRQERCVDASPLCQWCPKSRCNKVSMITEKSQHVEEFGCCVVCDCKSSYCFSCQANPHWPMSCSQAAAYRNLLYKLGNEIEIPVDVTCNVELKPCPGCKYPLEKNEGCQYMECSMCQFEFCWNCLRSSHPHGILWACTEDEDSHFRTYKLHTDVINSFPLKFFTNALDMKKKLNSMNGNSVKGWLLRLKHVNSQKIKLSFERSLNLEEKSVIRNRAVHLTTEIVSFLMDSYSFLEYFYILLSFAILHEVKATDKEVYLPTQRLIDRLLLITSRLEDMIVGKSLQQLIVSENTSQMFLGNGHEMLEKLKIRVTSIQKTSRDVPAKSIGELDPKKYYRYK